MYLIFDTETTGFPAYFGAPYTDLAAWETARCIQLAWQIHDDMGALVEVKNFIIKPVGFDIPYSSQKIHGISTERALQQGVDLAFVLDEFNKALETVAYVIGHNVEFDLGVMGSEYLRAESTTSLHEKTALDTKAEGTNYCQLPGGRGGQFKWPTLMELYTKLFNEQFNEAHNASADVEATSRAFLEMLRIGLYSDQRLGKEAGYVNAFKETNTSAFELIGLNIEPYSPIPKEASASETPTASGALTLETEEAVVVQEGGDVDLQSDGNAVQGAQPFVHLHIHTQHSVLQSTIRIKKLVAKAKELEMPAVAMTDRGNMYGAYNFVKSATDAGLKPIVGCELNVCSDMHNKEHKNNGFSMVFIAKNKAGYKNLCKLSSKAHTDGFYYIPRIDRKFLSQHKDELVVLSGGIFGEIAQTLLQFGETKAEEVVVSYKEEFGEDFYLEICRHGVEEQQYVNEKLIAWSQKHGIKLVATNNVHYLDKSDSQAHDILLCVKDAKNLNQEKVYIGKGNRETRFGFPNKEFYFKTPEEMAQVFHDLPGALSTTQEIVDKIEPFVLKQDVLLPKFDIPSEFVDPEDEKDGGTRGENAYLRHLTYEGAKKRYGEITPEISERLDFELLTIANSGYPGYFLIVQDFTSEARKMGVWVGPGRGSAAGSAVAYCVGITNVDPIKYDLLFERFLNPERVSLPDIDIDFDDRGRDKIIEWVVDKYGSDQVAQIITYGTMAAKSSIRDTARAMELPLGDADRIAKLIPDVSLHKLLNLPEKELKAKVGDRWQMAAEFRKIAASQTPSGDVIRQAAMLEGSLRNTGTHACGVIITPSDITDHVPVANQKGSNLVVTQFDNGVVEDAGLLKMDFLGLKTLTLIKDAIELVKDGHGIDIDPDLIPLDDVKTYELFQRGETNGIFQYESAGMQKHMKNLAPDSFADLIAMNALYRPGPIAYIPEFIERKHGRSPIEYDLPAMEEYLEETYGITVYQEQVMLLSQKLAGFTKGEADALRKGMGKKKKEVIDAMWPKFLEGCQNNGHPEDVVKKIWKDWEAFASYAFNKSHSTCYAFIAFQTAYLKANYPAEYMASVLSNNMEDIKKVTFFMEECRRMGIPVLGPSANESSYRFAVNAKGEIRFGLGAIKGVGENAVMSIVEERKENGPYADCFDFVQRVDLKSANKKCLESMVLGGGWDDFGLHRSQYLFEVEEGKTFLDQIARFGQAVQQGKNGPATLFGDSMAVEIRQPVPPDIPEWDNMVALKKEKDVIGIYLSAHPLDDFKIELDKFSRGHLGHLSRMEAIKGKEMAFGAILSAVQHRMTKNGKPFGIIELEDYHGSHEIFLFGEDYTSLRNYLIQGSFLFVKGRVQDRKFREGELEFKLTSMEFLSDIRKKMIKSITINMELRHLTPEAMERITALLNANKGEENCSIRFEVIDREDRAVVELPSRTFRVDLTNELVEGIENMDEFNYTLN